MRPPTARGLGAPLRSIPVLLAAGALSLLTIGCGGGDDDAADDGTTSTGGDAATTTVDAGGTSTSLDDAGTSLPSTTADTLPGGSGFTGVEEVVADLGQVAAMDVDAEGAIWATESTESTLFEIVDGEPVARYVGEQESTEPESAMSGLAIAPDGMVWFATRRGVHRLDPATDETEVVLSAAGTDLSGPTYLLATDGEGSLYVGDAGTRKVYRLEGTELVHVAGSGGSPVSDEGTGDGGPAVEATLGAIRDLVVDGDGNLYIADDYSQRVRRVAPDGTMDTVAGGGASAVSTGSEDEADVVDAVDLDLEAPTALLVIDDELFVSDVTLDVVIAVDGDGVHHLVLPSIQDTGSVERLAGIDSAEIYVGTPDIIGRLAR